MNLTKALEFTGTHEYLPSDRDYVNDRFADVLEGFDRNEQGVDLIAPFSETASAELKRNEPAVSFDVDDEV